MNITVYLGASFGNDPDCKEATLEMGRWIGRNGHRLIYGGSRVGLMGLVADGALECGAEVIGVEPGFFIDIAAQHEGLTELIVTETMAERKQKMLALGDAFVAMPGGTGTLEEIVEAISLLILGKLDNKPCIIFNLNGFYEELRQMFDKMTEKGFLLPENRDKIIFADTLEQVFDAIRANG